MRRRFRLGVGGNVIGLVGGGLRVTCSTGLLFFFHVSLLGLCVVQLALCWELHLVGLCEMGLKNIFFVILETNLHCCGISLTGLFP